MPGLTLWLVRHGQSTANVGQPAEDHLQIALTELGHAQAQAAALRCMRAPSLLVVSPMRRAAQTAAAFQARWPGTPVQVWPIGEFTYLSPVRCAGTTPAERRAWVADYWERCDPAHVDGEGAESFAAFMGRVSAFHARAMALAPPVDDDSAAEGSFIVAVGHGQFFRACTLGTERGFAATAQAMRDFRAAEVASPLANGEVVEILLSARTGG